MKSGAIVTVSVFVAATLPVGAKPIQFPGPAHFSFPVLWLRGHLQLLKTVSELAFGIVGTGPGGLELGAHFSLKERSVDFLVGIILGMAVLLLMVLLLVLLLLLLNWRLCNLLLSLVNRQHQLVSKLAAVIVLDASVQVNLRRRRRHQLVVVVEEQRFELRLLRHVIIV